MITRYNNTLLTHALLTLLKHNAGLAIADYTDLFIWSLRFSGLVANANSGNVRSYCCLMWVSINGKYIIATGRIHVQETIYCRLLIGRDGHLDQSEAYNKGKSLTIYRNLYEGRFNPCYLELSPSKQRQYSN